MAIFKQGWARYAEGLAEELGVAPGPYERAGRLLGDRFWAARAVIETEIHWNGWSCDQAVRYFESTVPWADHGVTVTAVETAAGGGSMVYMLGQYKIAALRRYAEKALGSRFDVRRFHDQVLRNGPVPMDVLDAQIHDWVAQNP